MKYFWISLRTSGWWTPERTRCVPNWCSTVVPGNSFHDPSKRVLSTARACSTVRAIRVSNSTSRSMPLSARQLLLAGVCTHIPTGFASPHIEAFGWSRKLSVIGNSQLWPKSSPISAMSCAESFRVPLIALMRISDRCHVW